MMTENKKTGKIAELITLIRTLPPRRLQLLLSVAIISVAVVAVVLLVSFKKQPEKAETETLAPLVEVQALKVRDIPIIITGFGTVKPKVQVQIVPQVSGKVVSIHPQLRAGGLIRADRQLLQIDKRDYELAVRQAQAAVAEAQVKLDMELAEAEVVKKEWQQLYPGTEPDSPLVLREPQIRQEKARLDSAKAALLTAGLNLERTSLTLPIDARIVTENVDLGQFVIAGQPLAAAYGTDAVEIELPLEDEQLAWFDIPDEPVSFNGNAGTNAVTPAEVKVDFAGREHIWTGRVVRTTGTVDTSSRLVSVVVEVDMPFDNSDSRPSLLPGTFVEVRIQGKVLKKAVAIPRSAIHNGNELWLVSDSRLQIRGLNILRTDDSFAYVTEGIADGAEIVISPLDIITENMKVRTKPVDKTEQ